MKALLVVILLVGFAQGQVAKKKQPVADVNTRRLSSYMRDVGLDYIETVERGVDVMTDPDIPWEQAQKRSAEQFKLLKPLEDRIEIHAEGKADKDFYTFGLRQLGVLGQEKVAEYGLALALMKEAKTPSYDPNDPSTDPDALLKRSKRCLYATERTTKLYIHCDTELRAIIKDGEYDRDKLVEDCKLPILAICQ